MDRPPVVPVVTNTLDQCHVGSFVRVSAISGELSVRRRLMEMGLCPGVQVEVIRRAPLGDPIELRVRGYLLSIRGEQASLIGIATTTPC